MGVLISEIIYAGSDLYSMQEIIDRCESLLELKNTWSCMQRHLRKMSKEERSEMVRFKDRRKDELIEKSEQWKLHCTEEERTKITTMMLLESQYPMRKLCKEEQYVNLALWYATEFHKGIIIDSVLKRLIRFNPALRGIIKINYGYEHIKNS